MSQNPSDPKDARLVEIIQSAYNPPVMSPDQAEAFTRRLDEEIRKSPLSPRILPVVLLAAAALLVWVQIQPDPAPISTVAQSMSGLVDTNQGNHALFLEEDFWQTEIDTTMLPDSYQQLSALFLTP